MSANRELDRDKQRVPGDRMRGDDHRREVDWARDESWLALAHARDQLCGECAREHERLHLKGAVEDPQDA
jgi:hypothetical protein